MSSSLPTWLSAVVVVWPCCLSLCDSTDFTTTPSPTGTCTASFPLPLNWPALTAPIELTVATIQPAVAERSKSIKQLLAPGIPSWSPIQLLMSRGHLALFLNISVKIMCSCKKGKQGWKGMYVMLLLEKNRLCFDVSSPPPDLTLSRTCYCIALVRSSVSPQPSLYNLQVNSCISLYHLQYMA